MLPPLNDTRCLQALHDQARACAAEVEAEVRALRAHLIDVDELAALVRAYDDPEARAQRDARPPTTNIQPSHTDTGENHAADSAAQ